ncbi:MAG TPA: hypothetical protein VG184_13905 [Acidimicrobiales bacterium]|jgi:hypothetical protein|nr:hypothetical protein [Acidimicrobiales bacterium]
MSNVVHAFVASQTSQFGATGSNSAPWDVLWIFLGSVLFVVVVAGIGAALNHREAHAARDEGTAEGG